MPVIINVSEDNAAGDCHIFDRRKETASGRSGSHAAQPSQLQFAFLEFLQVFELFAIFEFLAVFQLVFEFLTFFEFKIFRFFGILRVISLIWIPVFVRKLRSSRTERSFLYEPDKPANRRKSLFHA